MLIMLVYYIILVGISVSASDANRSNEAQSRTKNHMETVGGHRQDMDNYMSLGFSTPVDIQLLTVDSWTDDIQQGIYREAWSLCIDSLWNTCVGRCGQSLYGAPYVCGCDALCPAFGDCCLDYELECTFNGPYLNATSHSAYFQHLGKMVCISMAQDYNYGVLVVTECADWWPKGDSKILEHSDLVRDMCENPRPETFKPVQTDIGLVFKNAACYVCNNLNNRNQDQVLSPTVQVPATCRRRISNRATYRELCRIERMHHPTYRVCAYEVNECPDVSATTSPWPYHRTTAQWGTSSETTTYTTSEVQQEATGGSRDGGTLEATPLNPEAVVDNYGLPGDSPATSDTVSKRSDHSEVAPEKPEAVPDRLVHPGTATTSVEAEPETFGNYETGRPAKLDSHMDDQRLDGLRMKNETIAQMNDLCSAYSKPLFGRQLFGDTQSYKNVHCAHCHKKLTSELFCPSWKVVPASRNGVSGPVIFFETGLNAANKFEIRDIPASFAILYHFGSDGSQGTMFSSQGQKWWDETMDNCDDDQIWDPFAEICRQVYCSAEFTLVDFQCVQIYNSSSGGDSGDDQLPDNITQAIQNVDLTEVQVILAIELDCCVNEDVDRVLEDQFVDALAASLNITADRFANFTLYNGTLPDNSTMDGCPRDTAVSLVLLGPNPEDPDPQPSIEKVMASLSYGVALNHLLLHLEAGIIIRIFGLKEKIIRYINTTGNATDAWCQDGRQLYYTTGEFTPFTIGSSVENVTLYVYVNVTGYTYLPGQYIANILFEGNQRSVLANVTGAVVVCERSDHNNTCVRVMLTPEEYVPLANGSIVGFVIDGNVTQTRLFEPGSYEIMSNGDALVCVLLPPTSQPNAPYLLDMQVQSMLTTVLLSLSSLAILATILTYAFFSELRNLPGWNMLHLAFCLLLYQLIYLSGMRPSVTSEPVACEVVAVSLHYTLMAFFFWMNVIAYDLFKTFGRKSLLTVATRDTALLPWYALYAYGVPLVIVGGCVAVDQLSFIPGTWVGYGQGDECWIANPVALVVVFAGPTLIIIVVNFALYAVTVVSIRKIRCKTKLTTGLSSGKSQLLIYARISTVMGFTWIFGHLSGIPDIPYALHDVFSYLFIVLNTFQGALIFFAFVCNKKILRLYRNCDVVVRLLNCIDSLIRCKDCQEVKCVCQKPVTRTISNETCQSIITDEKNEKQSS